MRQLKRQHGLTLIELCITMAIAGILSSAALPSLVSYVINARLKEAGTVLMTESLFARSEAIKRNTTIHVGVQGSVLSVTQTTGTTTTVLRTDTLPVGISAPGFQADFNGSGRSTPFGSTASVLLGSAAAACSTDIRCPTVTIDAGGSLSQCMPGACV